MDPKISDIGERAWIEIIQKYISSPVHLSKDDDAVAYEFHQKFTVINVDTWVESTDRPLGMEMRSCGYKSVVNAVSDVLAKGAEPLHILSSLNLPGFTLVKDATEIVEGIALACQEFGLSYRGGDVNQQSSDITLTITCIGVTDQNPVPRHAILRPGDEVWWIGAPLGSTGAILHLLLEREDHQAYLQWIQKYYYYPKLPLSFQNYVSAYRPYLVSSMDCSDGLARSLYSLIEGNNLSLSLSHSLLDVESWIRDIASEPDQVRDFVLYGGEELSIIFITRGLGHMDLEGVMKIGEIIAGNSEVIHGDYVVMNRGWQHFKPRSKLGR